MTVPTSTLGAADVVVRNGGELCESPLWDPRIGRLMWVDIPAGLVHRLDLATGADEVVRDCGQPVGCVALRASGGYVVALARVIACADADWQTVEPVTELPGQAPSTRTNDGACDPSGRFWIGTLASDGRAGAGALYRLDGDAGAQQVLSGVGVSNGIDWSPDGSLMYYADTSTGRVDVLDAGRDGGLPTGRRPFAEIELAGAAPDGLTVDAEGFVWVAVWNGRRVRRYAPDGRLDREVLLPVDQVSSVAFAGPGLDALVVTTGREGLTDADVAPQPLAGSVFLHDPGVRGRAPYAWAG